MGAKAGVQFTATGGAGSPGSSFGVGSREVYAPGTGASPLVQNSHEELKLSDAFTRNLSDRKAVAKDVNNWLKNHGLTPLDPQYLDPNNPLLIGFTCRASRYGGGSFGGELSREGTLSLMQGDYGKIFYLNYGSKSSDGGKSMDILWFTQDGGFYFINRMPSKAIEQRGKFVTMDDYLEQNGDAQTKTFRLQNGQEIFTGTVAEGLKQIKAPNELVTLCRSLDIIK